MANFAKKNVTFLVRGNVMVLRFGVNELMALEERLNLPLHEIAPLLMNPSGVSMKVVHAMFWAGLYGVNPVSPDEAAELMEELGKPRYSALINEAFSLAFPEVNQKVGGARPPMSQSHGSGSISSVFGEVVAFVRKTFGEAPRGRSSPLSGIKRLC